MLLFALPRFMLVCDRFVETQGVDRKRKRKYKGNLNNGTSKGYWSAIMAHVHTHAVLLHRSHLEPLRSFACLRHGMLPSRAHALPLFFSFVSTMPCLAHGIHAGTEPNVCE